MGGDASASGAKRVRGETSALGFDQFRFSGGSGPGSGGSGRQLHGLDARPLLQVAFPCLLFLRGGAHISHRLNF